MSILEDLKDYRDSLNQKLNALYHQKKKIGHDIYDVNAEILKVKADIKEYNKQPLYSPIDLDTIQITDHAIIRYLERYHNINIDSIRNYIISNIEKTEDNKVYFKNNSVVYGAVQKNTIMTVLKNENLIEVGFDGDYDELSND